MGKITAPAITIAALKVLEKEEDAILLVLAADHDIKNNTKFIQSSIGANLDFMLFEKQPVPSPTNSDRLLLSFHLKFGYGMKFQNRLFIIPTLETPIINLRQWEKGKSTYGIFNKSRYRPIVFSCRFAWLKSPSRANCPPVYVNPGDKAKQDQHFME